MDRDLKRSIILDNYQSPNNKHTSDDSYFKINTRNEEEYDKEVLKELLVFDDTSKQPSRIKCATLSANGIKDYLEKENHS